MIDPVRRLRIQIVEAQAVHAHEIADPHREQRIQARLRNDAILRDPLIVGAVADIEGFVLLDGTNRKRALAALGLSRTMVQIIDYANPQEVLLQTWCHGTPLPMRSLLEAVTKISGVAVSPLPPLATPEALANPSTLAVLVNRKDRYALTQPREVDGARTHDLRALVQVYEDSLVRIDCSPGEIEEYAQRLSIQDGRLQTLIAFPSFSRSQVVAMAIGNNPIPAGITRHVILGGRALRVNLPLRLLDGSVDLEEAAALLERHLTALQPRLYQEPTVLFDS